MIRSPLALEFALALALTVGGCGGMTDTGARGPRGRPVAAATDPVAADPGPAEPRAGSVKVALLLPLSAAGAAATAAASLKNAADLAVAEFPGADLALDVRDDRGTPEGAREAANGAVADGAELVLGPLFAPSVLSAGTVARGAGRPVIAFSTDATAASRGVYLLSFLPGGEVDRVVDYAAAQGRVSVAALIPNTTYGSVVEGAFREAAARKGLRVAGIEHYGPGQAGAAVARLAPLFRGPAPAIDTLFVPAGPEDQPAIGAALGSAGFEPGRIKLIGTGAWGDPRGLKVAAFAGGWFASPDPAGFAAFAARYRARYGAEPARLATLAYDAASLAAALARQPGPQRFSEGALQTPSGFAGADGIFRFRPDGTNERALVVQEVGNGAAVVVSPAPKAFGPSGI